MSYGQFAYLYDELMVEAPYEQWVDYCINMIEKYGLKPGSMLDLACGTGELSIKFAERGFQVTGADLSADMLAVASAKAEGKGLKIPFYEQNMSELEVLGEYGLIGIFCDSLNYLSTDEEVRSTFKRVHANLNKDGLFIFDVHSLYKINQGFINQSFSLNEEEISYIWNSFEGQLPDSVEHEISFFVLDKSDGKYNRFDELHFQRTYPIEIYSGWLQDAGFELLHVHGDFQNTPPVENTERVFFTARKK